MNEIAFDLRADRWLIRPHPVPPCCTMCGADIGMPDLDNLISERRIKGHPAAILRAVWSGRGRPVGAMAISDVMFADDPDGGPSLAKSYRQMREALVELTEKLEGSGLRLVEGGHSTGGFRLTFRRP